MRQQTVHGHFWTSGGIEGIPVQLFVQAPVFALNWVRVPFLFVKGCEPSRKP
jgi:hypothetical protein